MYTPVVIWEDCLRLETECIQELLTQLHFPWQSSPAMVLHWSVFRTGIMRELYLGTARGLGATTVRYLLVLCRKSKHFASQWRSPLFPSLSITTIAVASINYHVQSVAWVNEANNWSAVTLFSCLALSSLPEKPSVVVASPLFVYRILVHQCHSSANSFLHFLTQVNLFERRWLLWLCSSRSSAIWSYLQSCQHSKMYKPRGLIRG